MVSHSSVWNACFDTVVILTQNASNSEWKVVAGISLPKVLVHFECGKSRSEGHRRQQ